MSVFVFGTSQATIGSEEVLIDCPSCGKMSLAEMSVIGKYYEVFLIPIFPYDKTANVTCKECGLKRHDLRYKFKSLNGNFSYPWYMYIGGTLFMLYILWVVISTYYSY
jgi:hypothetical protein